MLNSGQNNSFIEEGDEAGWIVTFADLMTLLLVFFVLLYSISSVNLDKFKIILSSFHVSLGEKETAVGLLEIVDVPQIEAEKTTIEELTGMKDKDEDLIEDVKQYISDKNRGEYIVLQVIDGKLTIRVKGRFLFDSGSATLKKEAKPLLDDIISMVNEYNEYNVNIKGHTDNRPIRTLQFPSNWELSAIRATTVLKFLVDGGVDAKRLTATGYGSKLPLASNTSEKNRAKNRRVEFVLEKK